MEHTTSDRGFVHLEPIKSRDGEVRVYESSNAMGPHIWLRVEEILPEGWEAHEAITELTLKQAKQLSKQLRWLIKNHYQNGGER